METCGMTCIKYLLFVFNFVFCLCGVGLIVAGSLVLQDSNDFERFVDGDVKAPAIVLIVIGCVIFLIAFLGCCGAIQESRKMLIGFGVLLLVIFIIELAFGIAAAANKMTIGTELKEKMHDSMSNYYTKDLEREAWGKLQKNMECCGVEGPKDWKLGGTVPASCCRETSSASREHLCQFSSNEDRVFQRGCFEQLKMRLKDNAVVIAGVGIGIAFIELAGVVLACFLAAAIKKEEEETKE